MTNQQEPDAREALADATAHLAAAISLLEKTPQAKNGAASDTIFNIMLSDYKKALKRSRAALRQLVAPGGEICPVCCGSGYSNHPDSGEICSACEGQGGKPTPSDERAKVIEECAKELFEKIPRGSFVSREEARRIIRALS